MYTVVKEALHMLKDNYVKRKRAEIEAVVREALKKWMLSNNAKGNPKQ